VLVAEEELAEVVQIDPSAVVEVAVQPRLRDGGRVLIAIEELAEVVEVDGAADVGIAVVGVLHEDVVGV
jgi:hypothetical protein